LGNLVDATRESVSRVMGELNQDGIIRISGKKVQILKADSLEKISING